MAKLSGFFMSTLLIVLCLWINVCHYPDAAGAPASKGVDADAAPVDVVPQSVSPASEPVDDATNESSSNRRGGLLAESAVEPTLLDVSASRPTPEPLDAKPAALPALEPAAFPVDGAEIDDAPAKNNAETPRGPLSNAAPNAASDSVSDAISSPSQTASPAVATPTQDARRSETKPRGAKYVRVPEIEIDAFSGGARTARSTNDEIRVVGATRAGQTATVAPSAR